MDLTAPGEREDAFRRLQRATFWSRVRSPVFETESGCFAGCAVVTIVMLTLLAATVLPFWLGFFGFLLGYLGVPIGGTIFWMLVIPRIQERLERRRARMAKRPAPIGECDPPEVDGSMRRRRVHGRVRVLEPVRSPLGGTPCAAFRLVGSDGVVEIDDAGVGVFEVVPAGEARGDGEDDAHGVGAGDPSRASSPDDRREEVVLVEGPQGTVRLPRPDPDVVAVPSPELREYLEVRAVRFPARTLWLGEIVLIDGDEVSAEGTASERRRADGYRGTATIRVLSERPGSPLVVRGAHGSA